MAKVPRLRIFAGPNGSGKSTIKSVISSELLGVYVNADEIEKKSREEGILDFGTYGVETCKKELFDFLSQSSLINITNIGDEAQDLHFSDNKFIFHKIGANPYFSAVAADFIRHKLLERHESFTFETVMSHPEKIELLCKAQNSGYRTYLYYVATNDPSINILRVRARVEQGGHPVPEDKIVSRYYNSLNLLAQAVKNSHRAYIFDNSSEKHLWLAEITDGKLMDIKTDQLPDWFKRFMLDKFNFENI